MHSLCEYLRKSIPGVRAIYSSAQAVYCQPLPRLVMDSVTPTPESTCGAHKLMTEIHINELHRKGVMEHLQPALPDSCRPAGHAVAGRQRVPVRHDPRANERGGAAHPAEGPQLQIFTCSPRSLAENLIRVLNMDISKQAKRRWQNKSSGNRGKHTQELMNGLAKYGARIS